MDNDISGLVKNITESLEGKNKKGMLENAMRLLSGEKGRKVLEALLSDGGESVRRAAMSAKNGDMKGVEGMISSIAETDEGRELLRTFGEEFKR